MKRSHLYYLPIFLLLFIFSCQNNLDKVNLLQGEELEGLTINSAQKWFNEIHNVNSNARIASKNTKTPNWDKALYLDFNFGEAVAIPLVYKDNYSVSFIKDKKDSKQTPKATMPLNSLNYLIIYKGGGNQYIEEVISIIPEEKYVLKSQNMKLKTSFDGMIHISNWDGETTKAYLYENGKIISQNLGVSGKNLRVALLLDCYETAYYLCPSENLTPNGEILNYSGCEFLSSSTTCFNTGGSNDNGGGGDSYSEILGFNAADTPVEKTRKLAAKVPQTYKVNGQCVQFANALKKAMLNNNITGQLLEVRTNIPNPFIISLLYNNGNEAISTNGIHQAIRVGDTVFDNLNPSGVDYNSWRGALDAAGGLTVNVSAF